MAPLCLKHETEWSRLGAHHFTPRKEHHHPLNRRLGGLYSPSGRFGEKSLSPAGIRTPHLSAPSLYILRMHPFSCQTVDLKVPKTETL